MNETLHKLLFFIHAFLFIVFSIGPFLSGKYLIYYLFLWPGTRIHWSFNDNMCMLTELEFKTNNNFFNNINEYIFHYTSNTLKTLNKFNINFQNFDSYNETIFSYYNILWIIVFIRALIYYRKDIAKDWVSIKKHVVYRFICDTCKG
jgi:hypothetical protein